jgi:lipoyl(octanoyl) transferase
MSQLDSIADAAVPMTGPVIVRELGLQDYLPVYRCMQRFTDCRQRGENDEIWVLQHHPVYTLGMNGKPEHVLDAGSIPLQRVDRGGQVTYHGPGQLIVYLLLDLRRNALGIRGLVSLLEDSVIELVARWGVESRARAEAPGVYVAGRKIASLGLRIRRGYSYHGLALNVDMDLEPFRRINPCGYPGLEVTQLCTLAPAATLDQCADRLLRVLCGRLGYTSTLRQVGLPAVQSEPRARRSPSSQGEQHV